MNTARLLKNHSQNKSKIQLIRDLCCESTQFIGLCETFLHDAISDSEIQMKDFSIYRTDHANRLGGGVCFYVKKSISCETLLSYSNSTCELLILQLNHPKVVIINLYHPP